MAETSWPFPDPENDNKRVVTDRQFELLYQATTSDGIYGHPVNDSSVVYADNTGMQVKVRGDRLGVLRGHGWSTDSDGKILAIGSNTSGSTRVDLVVLRLTRSTWKVEALVRAGTPGSGAPEPVTNIGDTGVYEIPLAEVTVVHNASSITADRITLRAWYIGLDGQIRCTQTSRPPHNAGRRIFEVDTGRDWVSTGSQWLRLAENAGPVALTLPSGFTAAPNALRRRNGWVHMAFSPRRNSNINANSTVTVGTIPVGYRPVEDIQTTGVGVTGQQVVAVTIGANGAVTVSPGPVGVLADRSIIVSATSWPVA